MNRDHHKTCIRPVGIGRLCGAQATREFCYAAEPWMPYCDEHDPQYATAGERPIRKVGDSTPPATPVEPTCVACDKGDHQHCLGGVCACIHSRDWKRQDEEWSAGDDQPASHLPPAALPAVSGEGERLKKFREHLVNYQQGTKQRGTGAYSRGEIVGVQGTLAVLLGEFDQLFPEVRASTPTPGAPQ